MVRAQLRAVFEDSNRGEVIVEAEGNNVRSAVAALFEEQPPSIESLAQFHPEVVGINIELTLEPPKREPSASSEPTGWMRVCTTPAVASGSPRCAPRRSPAGRFG